MLQLFLAIIFIAIILFLVVVALQPADFKITRTGTFNAPPSVIFPHIDSPKKWAAWSPWAKLDPNAKNMFEGPENGVGAKMSWAGNNKMGVGSMTIAESRPHEYLKFKLEFKKPMTATNYAEFVLTPKDNHTDVTWTMSGTNNFIGKAMNVIMNCEKMVGGQFEEGLASLKAIVETKK